MTTKPWSKDVVCLYDESGLAGRAWAEAGYVVHCYDIVNSFHIEPVGSGLIVRHHWDAYNERMNSDIIGRHAGRCCFLMAFPPCTDLAVSGAAHFESKRAKDPLFQEKAIMLFHVAEGIAKSIGCSILYGKSSQCGGHPVP